MHKKGVAAEQQYNSRTWSATDSIATCKLLIYKDIKFCFFSEHSSQSLMPQGFDGAQGKI
jgi:hypothetical protein